MLRHILLALALSLGAAHAGAEIRKPEIFADFRGFAIKGYDTVAYFTEGRAVKGDPAFAHDWKGTTWHFANAANRDAFAADPERYAPQFGGYCAWAVTHGRAVGVNPEIFRIVEDKLYLNLNMKVHQEWLDDMALMIQRGNDHWPEALIQAE